VKADGRGQPSPARPRSFGGRAVPRGRPAGVRLGCRSAVARAVRDAAGARERPQGRGGDGGGNDALAIAVIFKHL